MRSPTVIPEIVANLKYSRDRWQKLIDKVDAGAFDREPYDSDYEAVLNAAYERFHEHVKELDATIAKYA